MDDPVFPDERCVQTLRTTVGAFLKEPPSPQQCCDQIVVALHGIERAGGRNDWVEVATHAGTICSFALVLLLDACARMPPKGPAH